MLIEIHMLKNFAPTNLNRDDTGSPKTCYFGGVQRGRISSQCLKRSWRKSSLFQQTIGETNMGIRTRRLPDLVADLLIENSIAPEFVEAAKMKISGFGNKDGTENKKGAYTAQIAFYSPQDIQAVSDCVMEAIENSPDLKSFNSMSVKDWQSKMKNVNVRPITLDIALFGRMVTSEAFADVDASMQVAHAISTNRLTMEADFYTAVDDMISGDNSEDSGAGMMGDTDFNSCCYYIYACIDTDQLSENLKNAEDAKGLVQKAIPELVRAMAFSNPSGKQNTFAGHALPSAVLLECKTKKIPLSYANAFVKPATVSKDKDLIDNSIAKLVAEIKTTDKDFAIPVDKRIWFCSSNYDYTFKDTNGIDCNTFNEAIGELDKLLV